MLVYIFSLFSSSISKVNWLFSSKELGWFAIYPILSGKKRECIVYTHLFQFSKGHSIIMFSQNDQKLDLPPYLHLFHFGNSLPANVQTFTSNPNYHHHHYLPVTKTRGETFRSLLVTFYLLLVIFCSLLVTFRSLLDKQFWRTFFEWK